VKEVAWSGATRGHHKGCFFDAYATAAKLEKGVGAWSPRHKRTNRRRKDSVSRGRTFVEGRDGGKKTICLGKRTSSLAAGALEWRGEQAKEEKRVILNRGEGSWGRGEAPV